MPLSPQISLAFLFLSPIFRLLLMLSLRLLLPLRACLLPAPRRFSLISLSYYFAMFFCRQRRYFATLMLRHTRRAIAAALLYTLLAPLRRCRCCCRHCCTVRCLAFLRHACWRYFTMFTLFTLLPRFDAFALLRCLPSCCCMMRCCRADIAAIELLSRH